MSTPAPSSSIDTSFGDLRIRRVAGHIGGEVQDLAAVADLPRRRVDQLHAALVKHKVLFFRGQAPARRSPRTRPSARASAAPSRIPPCPRRRARKLFELDASKGGGRADSWHTDVTFVDAFPKISILRARQRSRPTAATPSGPTPPLAYERLPAQLKQLADQLWAVHSNDYDYGADRVQVEEERAAPPPQGVRLGGVRGRASGGARAPGVRRARAAARATS